MREYFYRDFGGWAGADGALGYDPVGVVRAEGGGAVGERRGVGVRSPEFGFLVAAGADDGVSGQRVCGLAAGGFWDRGCQPGQRDGGSFSVAWGSATEPARLPGVDGAGGTWAVAETDVGLEPAAFSAVTV